MLLPLFIIPARRVGKRLAEITRESYNLDAKMNATMTERFNVSGALLVKLFGRPDAEAARFGERAERVRDIGVQQAMYSRTFFVAMLLVASLAQALTYGLGGWLAVTGSVTAGTVVTLALLLTRLYGPLTALQQRPGRRDERAGLLRPGLRGARPASPASRRSPDAVAIPPGAGRLEFRDVHFRYPSAAEVSLATLEDVATLDRTENAPVLRGVDFTVEPGQMVALVGPSGAGKSTTSMLVSRVYDVTEGAVLVGGVDVRDATLDSLRDTIGVVTQDSHLFHETIAENLRYARPDATDDEMWAALRGAQVADLVRALPDGLDTVVGERGYRFSGGEKQRIAIARLLLKHPSIVILDEATAHLDSESEAAVQRALSVGAGRPHRAGHRPPALHRPRRRPDPGARRRPHRRARPARRPGRGRRAVRRALPHPVRGRTARPLAPPTSSRSSSPVPQPRSSPETLLGALCPHGPRSRRAAAGCRRRAAARAPPR